MSLSAWEQQALNSIKDGLADSDPELAALLTTFTELASGQEMPAREQTRASSRRAIQRWWRTGRRRGRTRARRVGQCLSLRYALLLLLVVTAALTGIAVALSLGGGQVACTGPWSTLCSDPAPGYSPASHGVAVHHVGG
jgi:hypothetical protein